MVRRKQNFCNGTRQMFWELKMCLWTIHQATKGDINGLVAHVHVIVILSIQVGFLFALKCMSGTLLNTFTICCDRWAQAQDLQP